MAASTRTTYQGKRVNDLTKQIITAANAILGEPGDLTLTQGGYNAGGVSASAGTHDGGGAIDITAYNYAERVKVFRMLGFAIWYRPTLPEIWSRHVHGIVDGDATASAGAKRQVVAYHNRRNGLANNGADRGYRMDVFPKFVYSGRKGEWMAMRATQGYTQPNAVSGRVKTDTARATGWRFENLATVKVGNVEWLVNSNLTFYKKADFNAVVDNFIKESVKYVVTADPSLLGLVAPGSGNTRKTSAAKGTTLISVGYVMVSGTKWVSTSSGTWYSARYLEPYVSPTVPVVTDPVVVSPAVDPVVAAVNPTVRIGSVNVIYRRLTSTGTNSDSAGAYTDVQKGLNYRDRLPLFAKKNERMRASIVMTQEAGTYAAGDAYAAALGSTWKSFLHGDNRGDLTNAVTFDSRKRKFISEGKFQTSTSPTHHNWATWVIVEDIATKKRFMLVDTHCEYRARGTTTAGSTYDKIREAQTRSMIRQAVAKAGGIPIVFGGDFNSSANQPYDGPGKAMAAAGYVDAEFIALVRKNAEYSTTNGLETTPRMGKRHIDRFFVKKGTEVLEWAMDIDLVNGKHRTPFASDHNGVVISVVLK